VKHLPRPISPTIPLFIPRTPVPNSKETPSAVIKVIPTSSSSVGHSARKATQHEHALSHYYVLLFIHAFASTLALPTFAFYNRSCYSPDRAANNSRFRYSPDENYLGSGWVVHLLLGLGLMLVIVLSLAVTNQYQMKSNLLCTPDHKTQTGS